VRARVPAILNAYGTRLSAWLAPMLPGYARAWTPEQTTFRPLEEAGRPLPQRARNDRLHTDAFPSRPTRGARILRVFTNLHPTRPRCWLTGAPFHVLLPEVADDPRCPRPRPDTRPSRFGDLVRAAAARSGFAFAARSPYDAFMLRFHDFLKANDAYQAHGGTQRWAFEPLSTWMVFTDAVPHAVLSGQYALEQTYLVPHDALAQPDLAPLAVLERRYGGPLIARPDAA